MYARSARNLQESCHIILKDVMEYGKEVRPRGVLTKELRPYLMKIEDPTARTLLYPKRGNNPFHALAETMWILADRNDIEWLSKFLPRAKDFSDDGKTWRAGYGPRIRAYEGIDDNNHAVYVDQINYIIECLKKDPESRQATIIIWNPAKECTIKESKDYACNQRLHFVIRDNKLECEAVARSTDAIWGYSSINVYEWTVLQEMIAKALKVQAGPFYFYSSSMHIYERHFEKAEKLIDSYIKLPEVPKFRFASHIHELDMEEYLCEIQAMCSYILSGNIYCADIRFVILEEIYLILKTYLSFIDIYELNTVKNNKDLYDFIHKANPEFINIDYTDLKVSCVWWFMKKINKDASIGEALDFVKDMR